MSALRTAGAIRRGRRHGPGKPSHPIGVPGSRNRRLQRSPGVTPARAGQLSDLSTATIIETVPQICRISHSPSAGYTARVEIIFFAQPPVVYCV